MGQTISAVQTPMNFGLGYASSAGSVANMHKVLQRNCGRAEACS